MKPELKLQAENNVHGMNDNASNENLDDDAGSHIPALGSGIVMGEKRMYLVQQTPLNDDDDANSCVARRRMDRPQRRPAETKPKP